MKEIDIWGDNRFDTFTNTRIACRGVIVNSNGKILVSREENTDFWLIPGGGLEQDEALEGCCIREVLEETGYVVRPLNEFLILNEYYGDYKFVSHYFECKIIGEGQQRLTDAERVNGLIPKWIDIQEFLSILGKHQDYAATNEEKRGAYLREYTALLEYLREKTDDF